MRLLFILLLTLFSFAAKAQGPQQMFWMMMGQTTPLVDKISSDSLKLAFSLRKLSSTYTGYAVRVKRSTDGTEQDIGFTGSGDFDGASFTAFVGGGIGYIATWYDPTGNGMNATQADTTKMLKVHLNVHAGRAMPYNDGDDYLTITGSGTYLTFLHAAQATVTAVWKPGISSDPNAMHTLIGNNNNTSVTRGYLLAYDDRAGISRNNALYALITPGTTSNFVVNAVNNNAVAPNAFSLVNSITDAEAVAGSARHFPYYNNAAITTANTATDVRSGALPGFNLQIGASGNGGNAFAGYITEIIVHSKKLSAGTLSTLNADINNYYSLY